MRRVTGIDAAFLAAETPEWHFHVSGLQIVDPTGVPGFSFEEFSRICAGRVHLVPQFRWKLLEPPFRLGWSWFVDDADFDIADHLRHVVLPAPGDRRALSKLVGDLISHKIDRSRPLWEMWFIEGLDDGRVAILAKVHHSIVDGESGADIAALLYDLDREPRRLPEPPPYRAEPTPSWVEIVARNGFEAMASPIRLGRLGLQMLEQAVAIVPLALGRTPPTMPFRSPHTPFNGHLSARRGFASAVLPLDAVKALKRDTDVKVNDVMLAVCAGVLRSYLAELGQLPERALVAQVPVSMRRRGATDHIGTQVGSMFVSLATDISDPLERLRAIHASSIAAKKSHSALAEHRSLGLSDAVLPSMFSAAARALSVTHLEAHAPPVFNLIISNVAGPPVDFYVGGAKMEHMYALGPLLYGGGLNITVFSNGDTIDVGLMTCPDLVPDPWTLADRFVPALEELTRAAGTKRRRPRKASR